MAVEVFSERKAVVLSWIAGEYTGPVSLHLTNPDTGEVSSTELVTNPGYAAVTYPADYSGTTDVTVIDDSGNVLDEGSITVGNAVASDDEENDSAPSEEPGD